MAHIRTTIRNALAARFAADVTSGLFKSVETDQVFAVDDDRLPMLRISWVNETVDPRAGREIVRRIEFKLEIYARGAPLQDTLDGLALQVEERIAADPSLGGVVMHCVYAGSSLETSGDGEKRTGVLTISLSTLV
jgi:hypothetical protein